MPAVARNYAELIAMLAEARRKIGVSQEAAGEWAGLPDRYLNSLECFNRVASWPTIETLLATFGLGIVLVEVDPAASSSEVWEKFKLRQQKRRAARKERDFAPDPDGPTLCQATR